MSTARKAPRVFRSLGTTRRDELVGLPLASFPRRLAAYSIDMFFVVILVGLASVPSVISEGAKSGKYHFEINPFHGWSLLSLPLYFGLGAYWGRGRTIGKRLMHIRIVSVVHEHLSLWHSVERALGYGASLLEGGLGFVQYFTHPNCQTVHDRIAETIVILDIAKEPESEPEQAAVSVPPSVVAEAVPSSAAAEQI